MNIKVMCTCGEEVADKDMKLKNLQKFRKEYQQRISEGADYVTPERIMQLIDALLDDLADFEFCLSEPERWKPEEGDLYYTVHGDGEIVEIRNADDYVDSKYLTFGNCFETRQEAEQARDAIKDLLSNFHKHGTGD